MKELNDLQKDRIRRVYATVQQHFCDQQAAHGFDHIQRVLQSSRRIASETDCDLYVVEMAALLHDVGDAKFHDGVERSGEFSRAILSDLGIEEETIKHVVHIVDNLSFRKRESAETLSIEGQVVQDADRLDALGAIGIVRTIEYGASIGQPFYCPEDPTQKSGERHFHEKLFKLVELMNTDAARQIAVDRETFMRNFLDQFHSECGAEMD